MNALEKLNQQIDAMPTWHQTAKDAPKNIIEQLELSPDDPGVASQLAYYVRCIESHVNDFPALMREIHELDQRLRQAKLARPDEGAQIATRELTHTRGRLANWLSEEIDAAIAKAHPAAIVGFIWHSARTADGRELSREDVRQSMRSAAYSNAGWKKYLSTLPRIEAPGAVQ